eukprot:368857-Pelagomonas_calceolata.AAC.6
MSMRARTCWRRSASVRSLACLAATSSRPSASHCTEEQQQNQHACIWVHSIDIEAEGTRAQGMCRQICFLRISAAGADQAHHLQVHTTPCIFAHPAGPPGGDSPPQNTEVPHQSTEHSGRPSLKLHPHASMEKNKQPVPDA